MIWVQMSKYNSRTFNISGQIVLLRNFLTFQWSFTQFMYMFIEWGIDFFLFNRFVKSNLLRIDLENSNEEFQLNERQNSQFANWLGGDVIQFLQNIQDQENGCVIMKTITELWRIKLISRYSTPGPSHEEIHGMVTSFLSYVRAHINGQTERTDVWSHHNEIYQIQYFPVA